MPFVDKIPVRTKKSSHTGSTRPRAARKTQGTLLYPDSAEREYVSLALRHARMYGEVLQNNLPEIVKIFRETRMDSENYHEDAKILDFSERFSKTIKKMEQELSEKLGSFDTDEFVRKVAKRANTTNVRQWLKLIKKNFGVDLDGHYYNRGTWADLIDRWAERNVGFVRSIPQESLGALRQLVQDAYYEEWGTTKLRNEISKAFGVSKKKAKMLAVDQMGTLCSQITRKQQTDAGITHYRWKSRNDNRVRESHRLYNGKIFSWDEPPPSWYMTKSRGRVYTGRWCHPGEDYCCRCMAIPVFNQATIDLPVMRNITQRLREENDGKQDIGIPSAQIPKANVKGKSGR